MIEQVRTGQAAFTAPHYRAAEAGQAILDAGGTASEAMVAAAAMIAVQYPHMNGLGGDSFWLISRPNQPPIAIDGCGAASMHVRLEEYAADAGLPDSGGEATITMAGTVAAWQEALAQNHSGLSLSTLLAPAIQAAREGILVTESLVAASEKTYARLSQQEAFQSIFLPHGRPLQVGETVVNRALAATLERLAHAGLDDFYRGELATTLVTDLAAQGSPLRLDDFHQHRAAVVSPLSVSTSKGQLYNFDAPTQGVASLLILAIYDQLIMTRFPNLPADQIDEQTHVHLLVEATKQAFIVRDRMVCDPKTLAQPLSDYLTPDFIAQASEHVSLHQALPWPHVAKPGDTVWMGAVDQDGTMVSFIQSVYWEFGSGCVSPATGIVWNNRGVGFSLDPTHHNVLAPNKKPFHTLNPAYAEFTDGRRMVYGTMGGEGQPQTQACVMSRYLYQGMDLQRAIAEPRWLLGRTWGDDTHQLRLEQSLADRIGQGLIEQGHETTLVSDCNELMGHAGAIVLTKSGQSDAATDPRSDGLACQGDFHGNT